MAGAGGPVLKALLVNTSCLSACADVDRSVLEDTESKLDLASPARVNRAHPLSSFLPQHAQCFHVQNCNTALRRLRWRCTRRWWSRRCTSRGSLCLNSFRLADHPGCPHLVMLLSAGRAGAACSARESLAQRAVVQSPTLAPLWSAAQHRLARRPTSTMFVF